MKSLLAILFVLLMMNSSTAYAATNIDGTKYIAVQIDGMWGFVERSTGALTIPCVYEEIIEPFQNNYALVCLGEGNSNHLDVLDILDEYSLIDMNGKPVVFDEGISPMSSPSSSGVVTIYQDGLYGLADVQGQVIVEPQYAFICSPADDRFWFQNSERCWGVMDESGTVIVEPRYQHEDLPFGEPPVYVNHYAIVRLPKHVVVIDWYGNEVAFDCDDWIAVGNVINNTEMMACLNTKTDLYSFRNVDGTPLTPEIYEDYLSIGTEDVAVLLEGKWGILNGDGEVVLPCMYSEIFVVNHSTVCAVQNSEVFYITLH